ncbi:MAG TPA: CHAD domain-containing protein [Nocardioidaceae bacterium]|jgi:CHAD domain-containing protein
MVSERTASGELLRSYLRRQIQDLAQQVPLVGTDEPQAVHRVRVAARRLRSVLATYRPALEPRSTDDLRAELRWLGDVLAGARDAQVQRRRVEELVRAAPAEVVAGTAVLALEEELESRYLAGRADAVAALAGERFAALVAALREVADHPPMAGDRSPPGREELPLLLERDLGRLRRRVGVAEEAAPAERARALHDVRKAAKRLRYAAESAAPELGEPALRLASDARQVQDVLGEHHDTVVVRQTVHTVAARLPDGAAGFTLGRLHALEEVRAAELEVRYADLVSELPSWGTSGRWLQTSSGSR